jgi:T5SS/PEP-CTERM-associated repeat protein
VSGGLTFDGGTLQFLSSLSSSRNFTGGTFGGTFDTGTNGTNVTLSGTISGPGSLLVEGAGTLTLTGNIGGDLDIGSCGCSVTTVKLVGGSLAVDGIGTGLTVEGGRLEVTNGGTLQVGITPTPSGSLLVAGDMLIDGPGSTVTVAGLTGVGIFGLGSLTISNGGVLNSQIGAEIDAFLPPLFGLPTVTVTGPGSTWNVGGAFGFRSHRRRRHDERARHPGHRPTALRVSWSPAPARC